MVIKAERTNIAFEFSAKLLRVLVSVERVLYDVLSAERYSKRIRLRLQEPQESPQE